MVALVDLDAMHAVDREKIAKHEAVRPVHRVEGAAHNALPGVETPAGAQAALPDTPWATFAIAVTHWLNGVPGRPATCFLLWFWQ